MEGVRVMGQTRMEHKGPTTLLDLFFHNNSAHTPPTTWALSNLHNIYLSGKFSFFLPPYF